MPGKRTFNPLRAKIHRSYSIEEVARLYGVHKQTVRNWIDAKLPTLKSQRPHLITGRDLREFHERRRQQRKRKCRPGELYCLRCRTPQRPAGGMLDYIPMTGSFRPSPLGVTSTGTGETAREFKWQRRGWSLRCTDKEAESSEPDSSE